MYPCAWAALLASCASAGMLSAADLSGTVVIERKLTRRSVTAPAPAYQRGVAVELGSKQVQDPLAFERSHVVVYLEGKSANPAPFDSNEPVSIEQQDRQFVPDLVVVRAGSTVSFPNLDAIFHNVFSLSKPRSFDLGNYSKGQTRRVVFPAPGIVYVYCHLHPNMAASIVITPNQWSAKVDGDGQFRLTGVPPGKYTAVAWHKTAGFFRQTVVVTEQGSPAMRFVIPFAADPADKSVATSVTAR
jgi:plastocyanin